MSRRLSGLNRAQVSFLSWSSLTQRNIHFRLLNDISETKCSPVGVADKDTARRPADRAGIGQATSSGREAVEHVAVTGSESDVSTFRSAQNHVDSQIFSPPRCVWQEQMRDIISFHVRQADCVTRLNGSDNARLSAPLYVLRLNRFCYFLV